MKKVYSLVFAMLISMVSIAANGPIDREKGTISLREIENGKLQLLYGENVSSTLVVRIYDENRVMLQRDVINAKQAFAKYYDFSRLASGVYKVEVFEGTELVNSTLVDTTPKVSKPVIFSKVERTDYNQFKLLVNPLLPSNMSVYVFENDKLIHEERLADTHGFQKLYRIQRLNPRAKIEFLVKSDDGFSELIAVK